MFDTGYHIARQHRIADNFASARLFAAAPELLAALEIALGVIDKAGILWMGDDKARAAIAKARGAA